MAISFLRYARSVRSGVQPSSLALSFTRFSTTWSLDARASQAQFVVR